MKKLNKTFSIFALAIIGSSTLVLIRPSLATQMQDNANCGIPEICEGTPYLNFRSDAVVSGEHLVSNGDPGPYTYFGIETISTGSRYLCDAPIQEGDKCCTRDVYCTAMLIFLDTAPCPPGELGCEGQSSPGRIADATIPIPDDGCFFGDPDFPQCN